MMYTTHNYGLIFEQQHAQISTNNIWNIESIVISTTGKIWNTPILDGACKASGQSLPHNQEHL